MDSTDWACSTRRKEIGRHRQKSGEKYVRTHGWTTAGQLLCVHTYTHAILQQQQMDGGQHVQGVDIKGKMFKMHILWLIHTVSLV